MTKGQLKFAAGVAAGLSDGAAYAAAFPKSKHPAKDAARLLSDKNPEKPEILGEIQRIRRKAEEMGGSELLTLIEKRKFLAKLVRSRLADEPEDSDLWQEISHTEAGTKRKLADKLKAITIDNDLASEGAQAAMAITITRAWK